MTDEVKTYKRLGSLDEVESFIRKYISSFSQTEVCICFMVKDGEYLPKLCKIEVKPKYSSFREDQDFDYGPMRFMRFHIPTENLNSYLEDIYRDDRLEVPALGRIELKVRSSFQVDLPMKSRFIHKYSNEPWFNVKSEWPYYFLKAQLEDQRSVYSDPLIRKGLPAYSHYSFAVSDFFDLQDSWQVAQLNDILVIIPDTRARITRLQLKGSIIEILLDEGSLSLDGLLIKLFAKSGHLYDTGRELKPSSSHITIELGQEPEFLGVYLLDAKTGDELDWKQIDLIWGSRSEGTDLGTTEDSLIHWIEKGEGENVEFKETIKEDSSLRNFKKTVTAFSNTKGGFIFIGVNDEGVAAKDCDIKDETIMQYIIDIEPMPNISIQGLVVGDKKIKVVRVEEGKDKPYNLKDQGVYVRRGKTNSRASRLEIQKLFSEKQS